MNKAKLKRMTRRTEFYMLIVLLLLCVVVQIKSGGKLITLPGIFTRLNVTVLRTMVVDGMFAMCSPVVMLSGDSARLAVRRETPKDLIALDV